MPVVPGLQGGRLDLRFSLPFRLAGLALLIAFVIAGAAWARPGPDQPVPVRSLRAIVGHYRTLTWTYERAAHERRTPTSYTDRRTTDRGYLQWAIDTWTRRSYLAQARALDRIRRTFRVTLPATPRLHGRLSDRVAYSRRLTLRLRKIYPGHVTRAFASARSSSGRATLRLWQRRSAAATIAVSLHAGVKPVVPAQLKAAFMCIHRHEGAWNAISNTSPRYYGGLQMDADFQRAYGQAYVNRWGTADRWPVWAQIDAAVKAHDSGRGFHPWPYTAHQCGVL
jgi:hypothetical protein